jgi:hypothetical protein
MREKWYNIGVSRLRSAEKFGNSEKFERNSERFKEIQRCGDVG